MDEQTIAEEEYQLQYFGFTGRMVFQQFTEFILTDMNRYIDNYMSKNLSAQSIQLTIFSKVQNQWLDQSEEILKKLEPILIDFFKIPSNVLLPTDSSLTKIYNQQEVDELQKEVDHLNKELLKEKAFLHFCEKELTKIEEMESIHDKLKEDLKKAQHFKTQCKLLKKFENIANTHEEYAETAFNSQLPDNKELWLANKLGLSKIEE